MQTNVLMPFTQDVSKHMERRLKYEFKATPHEDEAVEKFTKK